MRVPQDAALVGNHNEPLVCALPKPSLASIELGYERVRYRAAELLDQMMDGAPAPAEPILLEPTALVPRQSTDSLAVEDPLLAQALRFVAEHGHERIKVSDVAAAGRVTRRTLQRRFVSVLRRSIGEEVARLRVERAKRLLAESKASIKRLAPKAGFRNAMQMCTVFKRVEGITPSEFPRQRHQPAQGKSIWMTRGHLSVGRSSRKRVAGQTDPAITRPRSAPRRGQWQAVAALSVVFVWQASR